MSELFAGIAPDGSTRFISEVGRGRSCDCRCPECASPLVAKQGALKVWHFAHEGGQERPECEVGAANLLRRLAIELLRARPRLELPLWHRTVEVRVGMFRDTEAVELTSDVASPWEWHDDPPRHGPAASSRLSDGVPVEIHVSVGGALAVANADIAVVTFWLPIPQLEHLQSRLDAISQIERSGTWAWLQRPDPAATVVATGTRLRSKLEARELIRQQTAMRVAAESAEQEARAVEASRAAELKARAKAAEREQRRAQLRLETVPGLAPDHDGKSGFLLYVVERPPGKPNPSSAAAWILYTLSGGETAVVPWPPNGGHRLPAHVGRWDDGIGGHRATLMDALLYLRTQRVAVRTTSDIGELADWVCALSAHPHGHLESGARSNAGSGGG